MFKKSLSIALAASFILLLCSCGTKEAPGQEPSAVEAAEQSFVEEVPDSSDETPGVVEAILEQGLKAQDDFSDAYANTVEQVSPDGRPGWTEQEITITSGNDVLAATLTLPENADTSKSGSVPFAILAHGLSASRYWVVDCAWALADIGVASVRFDFAGFGDSTGTSEEMTVTSLVQNVNDVLDYAQSLDFVDTDHIFLLGKSMGGVASSLTAVERQDEVAGVILWYPAFNISGAVKDGNFLGVRFNARNIPDTVTWFAHKYGREFIVECGEIDTDQLLEDLDCPVLLLSGNRDNIVPLFSSMRAAELLSDCTFDVIESGSHFFFRKQAGEALFHTTTWLQEHLS